LLVSGLARPQSFEADALSTGASLAASLRFSDHARFVAAEARTIAGVLRETGAGWILSSEKNAVRLEGLELGVPIWALRSVLVWDGDDPGNRLAEDSFRE
jgi:tetraacyldisaccharide 4'-kinase